MSDKWVAALNQKKQYSPGFLYGVLLVIFGGRKTVPIIEACSALRRFVSKEKLKKTDCANIVRYLFRRRYCELSGQKLIVVRSKFQTLREYNKNTAQPKLRSEPLETCKARRERIKQEKALAAKVPHDENMVVVLKRIFEGRIKKEFSMKALKTEVLEFLLADWNYVQATREHLHDKKGKEQALEQDTSAMFAGQEMDVAVAVLKYELPEGIGKQTKERVKKQLPFWRKTVIAPTSTECEISKKSEERSSKQVERKMNKQPTETQVTNLVRKMLRWGLLVYNQQKTYVRMTNKGGIYCGLFEKKTKKNKVKSKQDKFLQQFGGSHVPAGIKGLRDAKKIFGNRRQSRQAECEA